MDENVNKNKEETLWSLTMELIYKIYDLTKDSKLRDEYKSRATKAYWSDDHKAEKARKEELEYFCGRSTFYPYEL